LIRNSSLTIILVFNLNSLTMNLRQRIKLSMYLVIKDFLANFPSITAAIPNFTGFFTAFIASIVQIQSAIEQQMLDKQGSTGYKASVRKTLAIQAVDVASKVYAWAKFNNNMLLMSEVKATSAKLSKLADVDFRTAVQTIYDLAQANIAALAPHGLSTASQTSFLNAINLFASNQTKPRLTIADHKQITKQLASLFDATDAILLNMKILVNTQRVSQTSFYNGFYGAIRQSNAKQSSDALRAHVIDAYSKESIEKVGFTFKLDYEASQLTKPEVPFEIEKLTAKKGRFRIGKMPDGIYQLRVFKIGYDEQNMTVVVNSDKLTVVEVELKKVVTKA